MNWLRSSSDSLILTDEAVKDFATVLNYFRLSWALSAQAHRDCREKDRKQAEGMAEYFEAMDAACGLMGAMLRQRFDIFRLQVARDYTDREWKNLNSTRRSHQMVGSPRELLSVYAITASSPDTGDDQGHGHPAGKPAIAAVGGSDTRPDRGASADSGGKPNKPRSRRNKGVDR